MKELIPIKNENGKQIVTSKDVHTALGFPKAHYARWCEENISNNRYAFENTDFGIFTKLVKNTQRGRPSKEYWLTIDFAERLAMQADTLQGEDVRKYFQACRDGLKKITQEFKIPTNFREALLLAADQQLLIEQMQPKADYADEVLISTTSYTTTQIAKGFGMTAVKLNSFLQSIDIQFKQRDCWVLKAPYQNKGYETTTTAPYENSKGEKCSKQQMEWYELGKQFIYELLVTHNMLPKKKIWN